MADLEVCYTIEESWRLAALLDVLADVYSQAKRCDASAGEAGGVP